MKSILISGALLSKPGKHYPGVQKIHELALSVYIQHKKATGLRLSKTKDYV